MFVLAVAFLIGAEHLRLVIPRAGPLQFFLHRNDVRDGRRTVTRHSRPLQRLQRNLAIRLELHDRHLQQFRAVLEAILRRGFRRQLVRERVRESQQILQGVVVLVVRQPTKRRVLLTLPANPGRCIKFPAQPIDNLTPGLVGEGVIGFVCRGHLRLAEHAIHLAPALHIGAGQQIGIQLIDPQSPLSPVRTMTRQATLLQNWLDRFPEVRDVRLGSPVGSRRDLLRPLQKSRFRPPLAFRRCQREWSVRTISGDQEPRGSQPQSQQQRDEASCHGRFFALSQLW